VSMSVKNNSSGLVMKLVLVLVVCALVTGLYLQLDYRIVKEDKGYQGEAKTNPYLAAEFFLRRMGQKTKKVILFSDKQIDLGESDTLLIPSSRTAFDSRRSVTMLEWVKQGGHLIITGQSEIENKSTHADYILDTLGLTIQYSSLDEASTQEEEPVNVAIPDEDYFWQIDFDDYLNIKRTSEFNAQTMWIIEDEDRIHGLQLKLGKGRVSVLSDMRFFKNDYIDGYDHAAFLFSLTNDQLASGGENIFYYSAYERQMSLLNWLWENAQALMLSLILSGVIVLWILVPRFGPLINIQQPIRRQFLDHLAASGNYHWRQGNYAHLLHEVRKQLSHRVKHAYPEWSGMSRQDQLAHFSQLSGLEQSAIEKALFDTNIERINDFVSKIKILEKLRKSL